MAGGVGKTPGQHIISSTRLQGAASRALLQHARLVLSAVLVPRRHQPPAGASKARAPVHTCTRYTIPECEPSRSHPRSLTVAVARTNDITKGFPSGLQAPQTEPSSTGVRVTFQALPLFRGGPDWQRKSLLDRPRLSLNSGNREEGELGWDSLPVCSGVWA